jgi:hypothetical protein
MKNCSTVAALTLLLTGNALSARQIAADI